MDRRLRLYAPVLRGMLDGMLDDGDVDVLGVTGNRDGGVSLGSTFTVGLLGLVGRLLILVFR